MAVCAHLTLSLLTKELLAMAVRQMLRYPEDGLFEVEVRAKFRPEKLKDCLNDFSHDVLAPALLDAWKAQRDYSDAPFEPWYGHTTVEKFDGVIARAADQHIPWEDMMEIRCDIRIDPAGDTYVQTWKDAVQLPKVA